MTAVAAVAALRVVPMKTSYPRAQLSIRAKLTAAICLPLLVVAWFAISEIAERWRQAGEMETAEASSHLITGPPA